VAEHIVTYRAESRTKDLKSVFRDMWVGLRTSHYTAYRLAVKDIKSEYAKSAFGMI